MYVCVCVCLCVCILYIYYYDVLSTYNNIVIYYIIMYRAEKSYTALVFPVFSYLRVIGIIMRVK